MYAIIKIRRGRHRRTSASSIAENYTRTIKVLKSCFLACRHVEDTFYEFGGFVSAALDPREGHSGEGRRIATQIRSVLDATSIHLYIEESKHTYNAAEVSVPAPRLPASLFFVGPIISRTLRKDSA